MFNLGTEIFYSDPDDLKSGWYIIDRIRKIEGEKDVYLISNEFHTIETTVNCISGQPAYMEENLEEFENDYEIDD